MTGDLIRLFVGTAGVFVGLIFLRAAFHKAADLPRFEGVLADYDLVPEALVRPASRFAPILELAVAAMLAVGATRPAGAAAAGLLLAAYAAAMGINLIRGRTQIDCGCGGAPEPLSWRLVGRNVLLTALVAPSIAGLGAPLSVGESLAVWAVAAVAFLSWGAVEQLLANAGRMADDRRHALSASFGPSNLGGAQ